MEKAASCHKVDGLVASLLSFCSIQSSLGVREFHAAGEERKRGSRCEHAAYLIRHVLEALNSTEDRAN